MKNDEPIYTYNDEFMRHFVRQSIKGGGCAGLNQYYKSTNADKVFKLFSKELDDNGNICEILEKSIQANIKKLIENEYDSQFKDYRKINQDQIRKYINDKLNKLRLHEKLQKVNLNNVMMDFDATSLCPSAMWDEKSVYPKIGTGFAFKPHMNNVYIEAFSNQTFNQNGNESAILKIK